MTKKNKIVLGAASVVAAIGIGTGVASCGGPAHKPVDGDKASNCWAHPDKNGSRHCAAAVAPRFGNQH